MHFSSPSLALANSIIVKEKPIILTYTFHLFDPLFKKIYLKCHDQVASTPRHLICNQVLQNEHCGREVGQKRWCAHLYLSCLPPTSMFLHCLQCVSLQENQFYKTSMMHYTPDELQVMYSYSKFSDGFASCHLRRWL